MISENQYSKHFLDLIDKAEVENPDIEKLILAINNPKADINKNYKDWSLPLTGISFSRILKYEYFNVEFEIKQNAIKSLTYEVLSNLNFGQFLVQDSQNLGLIKRFLVDSQLFKDSLQASSPQTITSTMELISKFILEIEHFKDNFSLVIDDLELLKLIIDLPFIYDLARSSCSTLENVPNSLKDLLYALNFMNNLFGLYGTLEKDVAKTNDMANTAIIASIKRIQILNWDIVKNMMDKGSHLFFASFGLDIFYDISLIYIATLNFYDNLVFSSSTKTSLNVSPDLCIDNLKNLQNLPAAPPTAYDSYYTTYYCDMVKRFGYIIRKSLAIVQVATFKDEKMIEEIPYLTLYTNPYASYNIFFNLINVISVLHEKILEYFEETIKSEKGNLTPEIHEIVNLNVYLLNIFTITFKSLNSLSPTLWTVIKQSFPRKVKDKFLELYVKLEGIIMDPFLSNYRSRIGDGENLFSKKFMEVVNDYGTAFTQIYLTFLDYGIFDSSDKVKILKCRGIECVVSVDYNITQEDNLQGIAVVKYWPLRVPLHAIQSIYSVLMSFIGIKSVPSSTDLFENHVIIENRYRELVFSIWDSFLGNVKKELFKLTIDSSIEITTDKNDSDVDVNIENLVFLLHLFHHLPTLMDKGKIFASLIDILACLRDEDCPRKGSSINDDDDDETNQDPNKEGVIAGKIDHDGDDHTGGFISYWEILNSHPNRLLLVSRVCELFEYLLYNFYQMPDYLKEQFILLLKLEDPTLYYFKVIEERYKSHMAMVRNSEENMKRAKKYRYFTLIDAGSSNAENCFNDTPPKIDTFATKFLFSSNETESQQVGYYSKLYSALTKLLEVGSNYEYCFRLLNKHGNSLNTDQKVESGSGGGPIKIESAAQLSLKRSSETFETACDLEFLLTIVWRILGTLPLPFYLVSHLANLIQFDEKLDDAEISANSEPKALDDTQIKESNDAATLSTQLTADNVPPYNYSFYLNASRWEIRLNSKNSIYVPWVKEYLIKQNVTTFKPDYELSKIIRNTYYQSDLVIVLIDIITKQVCYPIVHASNSMYRFTPSTQQYYLIDGLFTSFMLNMDHIKNDINFDKVKFKSSKSYGILLKFLFNVIKMLHYIIKREIYQNFMDIESYPLPNVPSNDSNQIVNELANDHQQPSRSPLKNDNKNDSAYFQFYYNTAIRTVAEGICSSSNNSNNEIMGTSSSKLTNAATLSQTFQRLNQLYIVSPPIESSAAGPNIVPNQRDDDDDNICKDFSPGVDENNDKRVRFFVNCQLASITSENLIKYGLPYPRITPRWGMGERSYKEKSSSFNPENRPTNQIPCSNATALPIKSRLKNLNRSYYGGPTSNNTSSQQVLSSAGGNVKKLLGVGSGLEKSLSRKSLDFVSVLLSPTLTFCLDKWSSLSIDIHFPAYPKPESFLAEDSYQALDNHYTALISSYFGTLSLYQFDSSTLLKRTFRTSLQLLMDLANVYGIIDEDDTYRSDFYDIIFPIILDGRTDFISNEIISKLEKHIGATGSHKFRFNVALFTLKKCKEILDTLCNESFADQIRFNILQLQKHMVENDFGIEAFFTVYKSQEDFKTFFRIFYDTRKPNESRQLIHSNPHLKSVVLELLTISFSTLRSYSLIGSFMESIDNFVTALLLVEERIDPYFRNLLGVPTSKSSNSSSQETYNIPSICENTRNFYELINFSYLQSSLVLPLACYTRILDTLATVTNQLLEHFPQSETSYEIFTACTFILLSQIKFAYNAGQSGIVGLTTHVIHVLKLFIRKDYLNKYIRADDTLDNPSSEFYVFLCHLLSYVDTILSCINIYNGDSTMKQMISTDVDKPFRDPLDALIKGNKSSTNEDQCLFEDSVEDSASDESEYGEIGTNNICTYTFTNKEFLNQHWYNCHTCQMIDGVGVCSVCARICHKGHDVTYSKYGSFFCDCGAKEDGSCKALLSNTNDNTSFLMAETSDSVTATTASTNVTPFVGSKILDSFAPCRHHDSLASPKNNITSNDAIIAWENLISHCVFEGTDNSTTHSSSQRGQSSKKSSLKLFNDFEIAKLQQDGSDLNGMFEAKKIYPEIYETVLSYVKYLTRHRLPSLFNAVSITTMSPEMIRKSQSSFGHEKDQHFYTPLTLSPLSRTVDRRVLDPFKSNDKPLPLDLTVTEFSLYVRFDESIPFPSSTTTSSNNNPCDYLESFKTYLWQGQPIIKHEKKKDDSLSPSSFSFQDLASTVFGKSFDGTSSCVTRVPTNVNAAFGNILALQVPAFTAETSPTLTSIALTKPTPTTITTGHENSSYFSRDENNLLALTQRGGLPLLVYLQPYQSRCEPIAFQGQHAKCACYLAVTTDHDKVSLLSLDENFLLGISPENYNFIRGSENSLRRGGGTLRNNKVWEFQCPFTVRTLTCHPKTQRHLVITGEQGLCIVVIDALTGLILQTFYLNPFTDELFSYHSKTTFAPAHVPTGAAPRVVSPPTILNSTSSLLKCSWVSTPGYPLNIKSHLLLIVSTGEFVKIYDLSRKFSMESSFSESDTTMVNRDLTFGIDFTPEHSPPAPSPLTAWYCLPNEQIVDACVIAGTKSRYGGEERNGNGVLPECHLIIMSFNGIVYHQQILLPQSVNEQEQLEEPFYVTNVFFQPTDDDHHHRNEETDTDAILPSSNTGRQSPGLAHPESPSPPTAPAAGSLNSVCHGGGCSLHYFQNLDLLLMSFQDRATILAKCGIFDNVSQAYTLSNLPYGPMFDITEVPFSPGLVLCKTLKATESKIFPLLQSSLPHKSSDKSFAIRQLLLAFKPQSAPRDQERQEGNEDSSSSSSPPALSFCDLTGDIEKWNEDILYFSDKLNVNHLSSAVLLPNLTYLLLFSTGELVQMNARFPNLNHELAYVLGISGPLYRLSRPLSSIPQPTLLPPKDTTTRCCNNYNPYFVNFDVPVNQLLFVDDGGRSSMMPSITPQGGTLTKDEEGLHSSQMERPSTSKQDDKKVLLPPPPPPLPLPPPPPVNHFETCFPFPTSNVDFGGTDFLEIYDKAKLASRLGTPGLYVAVIPTTTPSPAPAAASCATVAGSATEDDFVTLEISLPPPATSDNSHRQLANPPPITTATAGGNAEPPSSPDDFFGMMADEEGRKRRPGESLHIAGLQIQVGGHSNTRAPTWFKAVLPPSPAKASGKKRGVRRPRQDESVIHQLGPSINVVVKNNNVKKSRWYDIPFPSSLMERESKHHLSLSRVLRKVHLRIGLSRDPRRVTVLDGIRVYVKDGSGTYVGGAEDEDILESRGISSCARSGSSHSILRTSQARREALSALITQKMLRTPYPIFSTNFPSSLSQHYFTTYEDGGSYLDLKEMFTHLVLHSFIKTIQSAKISPSLSLAGINVLLTDYDTAKLSTTSVSSLKEECYNSATNLLNFLPYFLSNRNTSLITRLYNEFASIGNSSSFQTHQAKFLVQLFDVYLTSCFPPRSTHHKYNTTTTPLTKDKEDFRPAPIPLDINLFTCFIIFLRRIYLSNSSINASGPQSDFPFCSNNDIDGGAREHWVDAIFDGPTLIDLVIHVTLNQWGDKSLNGSSDSLDFLSRPFLSSSSSCLTMPTNHRKKPSAFGLEADDNNDNLKGNNGNNNVIILIPTTVDKLSCCLFAICEIHFLRNVLPALSLSFKRKEENSAALETTLRHREEKYRKNLILAVEFYFSLLVPCKLNGRHDGNSPSPAASSSYPYHDLINLTKQFVASTVSETFVLLFTNVNNYRSFYADLSLTTTTDQLLDDESENYKIDLSPIYNALGISESENIENTRSFSTKDPLEFVLFFFLQRLPNLETYVQNGYQASPYFNTILKLTNFLYVRQNQPPQTSSLKGIYLISKILFAYVTCNVSTTSLQNSKQPEIHERFRLKNELSYFALKYLSCLLDHVISLTIITEPKVTVSSSSCEFRNMILEKLRPLLLRYLQIMFDEFWAKLPDKKIFSAFYSIYRGFPNFNPFGTVVYYDSFFPSRFYALLKDEIFVIYPEIMTNLLFVLLFQISCYESSAVSLNPTTQLSQEITFDNEDDTFTSPISQNIKFLCLEYLNRLSNTTNKCIPTTVISEANHMFEGELDSGVGGTRGSAKGINEIGRNHIYKNIKRVFLNLCCNGSRTTFKNERDIYLFGLKMTNLSTIIDAIMRRCDAVEGAVNAVIPADKEGGLVPSDLNADSLPHGGGKSMSRQGYTSTTKPMRFRDQDTIIKSLYFSDLISYDVNYDVIEKLMENLKYCLERAIIRRDNWISYCRSYCSSSSSRSLHPKEQRLHVVWILTRCACSFADSEIASVAIKLLLATAQGYIDKNYALKFEEKDEECWSKQSLESLILFTETVMIKSNVTDNKYLARKFLILIYNVMDMKTKIRFVKLLIVRCTPLSLASGIKVASFNDFLCYVLGDFNEKLALTRPVPLYPTAQISPTITANTTPEHMALSKKGRESLISFYGEFCTYLVENLKICNATVTCHPNARLYSELGRYVAIDTKAYYLQDYNVCLNCLPALDASVAVPLKLSTVKKESKYTSFSIVVKLTGHYLVSGLGIKIGEVKRSKMVRTLSVYVNNGLSIPIVELKNARGDSSASRHHWFRIIDRAVLAPGQTQFKRDFPLPVIACNVKIVYDTFYDYSAGTVPAECWGVPAAAAPGESSNGRVRRQQNHSSAGITTERGVSTTNGVINCPRCNTLVQNQTGICNNCGENVFQCTKCRSINYDERDPFLCINCGFCKYAKFEYSITAHPYFVIEQPLTNEESFRNAVSQYEMVIEKYEKCQKQIECFRNNISDVLSVIGDPNLFFSNVNTSVELLHKNSTPEPDKDVNKLTQFISTKYHTECHNSYAESQQLLYQLVTIHRSLTKCKSELNYPRFSDSIKLSGIHERITKSADFDETPTICENCITCHSVSIEYTLLILHVLVTVPELKQILKRHLLTELLEYNLFFNFNLAQKLISYLTVDDYEALRYVMDYVYGRIKKILNPLLLVPQQFPNASLPMDDSKLEEFDESPQSRSSSDVLNKTLLYDNWIYLKHYVALMIHGLELVKDENWELRLKYLFKTFVLALKHLPTSSFLYQQIILHIGRYLSSMITQLPTDYHHHKAPDDASDYQGVSSTLKQHQQHGGLEKSGETYIADIGQWLNDITLSMIPASTPAAPISNVFHFPPSSTAPPTLFPNMNLIKLCPDSWLTHLLFSPYLKLRILALNILNSLNQKIPHSKILKYLLSLLLEEEVIILFEHTDEYLDFLVKYIKTAHKEGILIDVTKYVNPLTLQNLVYMIIKEYDECNHENSHLDKTLLYLIDLIDLSKDGQLSSLDDIHFLLDLYIWIERSATHKSKYLYSCSDKLHAFIFRYENDKEHGLENVIKSIVFHMKYDDMPFNNSPNNCQGKLPSTVPHDADNSKIMTSSVITLNKVQDFIQISVCLDLLEEILVKAHEEVEEAADEEYTSSGEPKDRSAGWLSPFLLATCGVGSGASHPFSPFRASRGGQGSSHNKTSLNRGDQRFFLVIEKDVHQEDFLQGRMQENPYSSTSEGLGPFMRDIKNKVCRDCELIALLEDDSGMELLVDNKIINLNLPVKDVFKEVWLPTHPSSDTMLIIYRMRGLLGDATEEFIENLNKKKSTPEPRSSSRTQIDLDKQLDESLLKNIELIKQTGCYREMLKILLDIAHPVKLITTVAQILSIMSYAFKSYRFIREHVLSVQATVVAAADHSTSIIISRPPTTYFAPKSQTTAASKDDQGIVGVGELSSHEEVKSTHKRPSLPYPVSSFQHQESHQTTIHVTTLYVLFDLIEKIGNETCRLHEYTKHIRVEVSPLYGESFEKSRDKLLKYTLDTLIYILIYNLDGTYKATPDLVHLMLSLLNRGDLNVENVNQIIVTLPFLMAGSSEHVYGVLESFYPYLNFNKYDTNPDLKISKKFDQIILLLQYCYQAFKDPIAARTLNSPEKLLSNNFYSNLVQALTEKGEERHKKSQPITTPAKHKISVLNRILEYITSKTILREWKNIVSSKLPALSYVLKIMNGIYQLVGLVNEYPEEVAVDKNTDLGTLAKPRSRVCMPCMNYITSSFLKILHKLEQTSTEDHLGTLAESLMNTLIKTDPSIQEKIEKIRQQTKLDRKKIAMAKREKRLEALGMKTNVKGQVIAYDITQIGQVGEESGIVCCICFEGYRFQPKKLLAVYTLIRKVEFTHFIKNIKKIGFVTFSNFNVVHADCHSESLKQTKSRNEWEGATLINSNIACNSLLPLWGIAVPETAFVNSLTKFFKCVRDVTTIRDVTYEHIAYDIKAIIKRFALEKYFSDDISAGSKESNLKILPFLMTLAVYLITQHNAQETINNNLHTFVDMYQVPTKLSNSGRYFEERILKLVESVHDDVYYYCVLTLFVRPFSWFRKHLKVFLANMIFVEFVAKTNPILTPLANSAAATASAPNKDKSNQNDDTGVDSPLKISFRNFMSQYSNYKTALLFCLLCDGFYVMVLKGVSVDLESCKDNQLNWPTTIFKWLRQNDEAVIRGSQELLSRFDEWVSADSFEKMLTSLTSYEDDYKVQITQCIENLKNIC